MNNNELVDKLLTELHHIQNHLTQLGTHIRGLTYADPFQDNTPLTPGTENPDTCDACQ